MRSWQTVLFGVILVCFSLVGLTVALRAQAPEGIGIMVVAHGSEEARWRAAVEELVSQVSLPYPVELAYLEAVPGRSIPEAAVKLEQRGATKAVVIPLFISSRSGHIEEIKYILGLRDTPPPRHHGEEPEKVHTQTSFVLTQALDDHPLVADILVDRVRELSVDPSSEIAILVGHGTYEEDAFLEWKRAFSSLADQVMSRLGLKDVRYAFLPPHGTVGDWYGPELATQVSQAQEEGDVIVVPVFIGPSRLTEVKIPKLLPEGPEVRYSGVPLFPHPNLVKIVEERAVEGISRFLLAPIRLREAVVPLVLYRPVEVPWQSVAYEDGEIGLCATAVFRAMKMAFRLLWGEKSPAKGDVRVATCLATPGAQKALSALAGEVVVECPLAPKTDVLTAEHFTFTVTDVSTGRSVQVTVREELFPGGFFTLRNAVMEGRATPQDREEFQIMRDSVIRKLMLLPSEEIFKWELVITGAMATMRA